MNALNLTPTDVKKKLNPSDLPHLFMGDNATANVTTADVEETLEQFTQTVTSRVPSIYGPFMRGEVKGEILVRSARGGETTVQLGLKPVSDVLIWVNLDRPWNVRRTSDALRDGYGCTVNETTGLVTLDRALTADDTVVAEYKHGALPSCHLLRRMVLDLTAAEWARRLYADDTMFDQYEAWEKSAWVDLSRMRGKDGERMGIDMFDRLTMVDETFEERGVGGGDMDASGDMM